MSRYYIRVEGSLSAGLTSAFPLLDATQQPQTMLHGQLEDQSELARVLTRLSRLDVSIVEVRRIPGRVSTESR